MNLPEAVVLQDCPPASVVGQVVNWSLDRPVFWCPLATSGSPPSRWPVLEDACQRRGVGETRPQDGGIPAIAEFNIWYSLPMAPPAGPPVGHKLGLTRRNHRSLKVVCLQRGPRTWPPRGSALQAGRALTARLPANRGDIA